MSTSEGLAILKRLMMLFPALTGDEPRCAGLLREIEKFPRDVMTQAIDEYMTIGEKFLNPTQLFAIAYRINRQIEERLDFEARWRRAEEERQRFAELGQQIKKADAVIADMDDEDVLREWAPVLEKMRGKAREWADKWPASTVRTNIQFRLKVAGMLAGAA